MLVLYEEEKLLKMDMALHLKAAKLKEEDMVLAERVLDRWPEDEL